MLLNKWMQRVLLVVQFAYFAILCFAYVKDYVAQGRSEALVPLDILCILISLLFYSSVYRSGSERQDSHVLLILLFINASYLFCDSVWYFVEGVPSLRLIYIAVNLFYLICPVLLALVYWKFLDICVGKSKKLYRWTNTTIHLVAGVYVLFILTTPFTGWCFTILPDGNYTRGNLFILTIVVPFIMSMLCAGRILYNKIPRTDQMVLLTYLLPPMIGAVVQGRIPEAQVLAVGTFLSVTLLYTNYYVRKEAEIANLTHDLTRSKLKSLQLQINPHFLYNTLHSIAGLCDTDPQVAQEMIYRVSDYMRDNFTDIEKPILVTFGEELVQLDHYLAIESMRFPNISVEKEIEASDFLIPVSTLQPLVENAIKHGIGKRRKSMGTIKISSDQTDDMWVICVSDDGVGFADEDIQGVKDGHFGLDNVKKRLKILCNGELKISSAQGEGTTVQISIPKKSGGVQP